MSQNHVSRAGRAPGARRRRPHAVVGASVVGGLVVIAGAAYAVGYVMAGDNTPKNASVQGIPIGGMPAQEAEQKLQKQIAPKAEAAIILKGPDKQASIKPAAAGLSVDYAATVRAAGAGRSWSPLHIVNVLRGGGSLDLVTTSDPAKLKAAVTAVAPQFAVEPRDASLAVVGGKAKITEAVQGQSLDVDKATAEVRQAWLERTSVDAPLTTSDPQITTEAVTTVAEQQLSPVLSGPIPLKTRDGKAFEVPLQALVASTTVKQTGTTFTVSTDMKKLFAGSQDSIATLKYPQGRNASIQLQGGKPVVVPSIDGRGVTEANFIKAVQPVLARTGAERTAVVEVTKVPASYTTADAQKAGVKEVTGEFTTQFPYAEYRNNNLSHAAAGINNTYLKPGDTFSLNRVLGERTAGNGYIDGYVIEGGVLKKEVGGGVSQSATTTYNAAFFAGLEDVEHHPHSLYFPRYPAGREATVYYGSLDLKFRNNTNYGVLVQAYVNKAAPGGMGSITVRIWSTKIYTVKSSDLVKSNFTTGKVITSKDPKCEYQAPIRGFDVHYSRLFYQGGSLVRTEKFFWRYSPGDEIKCAS
ncbi:VanW family protein [Aestuariimicrobium sp. T2.26MG-19.2B]|uniref:VanW family protein n=1 Tax=Aestuariimicrobium sp. T2.26MG-19.2B TaxID=3040679 RepID=UPI002541B3D5|nr:VanW family protein [Aestuariimicrobium sp. T2.26MG-19.2B]